MTFLRNDKEKENVSCVEWRIAEYTRLSKEDGDKSESDSIKNQQKIIENHLDYMSRQGENIISVERYTDDGYPGGNFNRPDYQRMIRDIETGTINCIIVKDLSRLGRNYPELGKLMEDFFPQKGIRVISVLNSLDSVKSPETYGSAIVSFSNIVNDDYIRQLSIKIKSTLDMKRNAGEFIGNYAPFGYLKSEEDHHKLVVDPEAADVVRAIFTWYIDGMSASGIAKRLTALHIPTPSEYKTSKGCKGFKGHSSGGIKTGAWSITSVNTILKDEVYIGNLVQGKYKSLSYRSKKMVPNEQENWIVIEGTHEPIVSDEQFTLVHDRFSRHTRVPSTREEPYLFSGVIFCGTCGRRMTHVKAASRYGNYRCPTRTFAPEKCQCPTISELKLYAIVLEAVKQQISTLVNAHAAIKEARAGVASVSSASEYSTAIHRAEAEKKRLDEARFKLYDNFQRGIIDEDEYQQFRIHYKAELTKQDEYIAQLRCGLAELKESRKADDEFIAFFSKYGSIQTLDRAVVTQLIDRIVVMDSKNISVYFKFSKHYEKILDLANQE